LAKKDDKFIQLSRQVEELRKEVILLKNKENKLLKIEEELRTTEERLGKVIYDLPFPAEIYDIHGYTILVNRAFLEMCRVPSDDLIINKYNIFKDPLIAELNIAGDIKGAFAGELVVIRKINIQFEKFRRNFGVQKEGNAVFELTMFPIFNSKGIIQQVVAIWKYISIDTDTQSNFELLTATMEGAENGVFITDITGRIIWTNKAFTLLCGYNKTELIGNNPEILKSGEQDDQFYENMWETISSGKVWRGKLVNKKKDGTFFSELEMITPIKNTNGEIENYVAIIHDVTEQKKTEEELKKLNRALKTISACNSALIHSNNEFELYNRICELVVTTGGYNFAWIGLLDKSEGISIVPASYYGISENKLNLMMPYLNSSNNGDNPIIKALKLKQYQVVKYSTDEDEYFVRNRFVADNNFQSMIAFPLIENIDTFGVFCIYSNNLETFKDDEIKLLEELSLDISYGIKTLRLKAGQEKNSELLRKSEERYRRFFEEDLAGDYISDINGQILDCNESFVSIFGFSSIEEAKQYNIQVLHPDIESRRLLVERVKNEKRVRGLEIELKTIDNIKKYIIENLWGSFDENGELVQIKGYLFDITERKLAELALVESESRFRELVENINEIIFATNTDCVLTYITPSIKYYVGYKPEEVLGKPIIDFLFEEDIPGLEEYFKSTLENKLRTFEFRMIDKTGELRWVKTSARPINYRGNIIGIQGVITNIAELKEAVAGYKNAKEEAEKSEKLKTEFLAQMSHEIRTPVNVILSYNSLLREEFIENISEEYSGIFRSIDQASKRLVRTIDLILNMSMFQAGKLEISASDVDLRFILLNLVQEFKYLANEKNLDLNFVNNASEVYIQSDEFILIHVFQNLIENAIKYTDTGKVEVILFNNSDGKVCVDIKDTGIGISKDYLERMFKPFTQEDTGYSRKYEGVGLGLALVKNYLDLIGAAIKVDSEKGKGSVFTVIFK
jgi:PAS domain S-box-containing protein